MIRILGLAPHPEGGHFRETFRDTSESGRRAASTAIYFLLKAGEQSHWHAVDAAEGWHFYAGEALLLEISAPGGPISAIRLGPGLGSGERPQAVVPAGHGKEPAASAIGRSLAAPLLQPSRLTALRSPRGTSLQKRRRRLTERRRGNSATAIDLYPHFVPRLD